MAYLILVLKHLFGNAVYHFLITQFFGFIGNKHVSLTQSVLCLSFFGRKIPLDDESVKFFHLTETAA